MIAHLAVALVAAVVTAVVTPFVARLAGRIGALDHTVEVSPAGRVQRRARRVPTLGGLGMAAGFVVSLGVASMVPAFVPLFASSSEPLALVVGVVIIVIVGVVDDLVSLPPAIKLAGQIVAALAVVVLGIQLVHFWMPGIEIIALSADLGFPLTIIALVAMINAMNLIDGLDGLAAGVAAIAAAAFFVFTVRSQPAGIVATVPTSATLVASIVVGISLGFLVHNWHPARIFMGDTGSMLLGLLLGSAGIAYVGRTAAPTAVDFYGTIPLLVPVLVLAVPFLDTFFAVVRRVLTGRPVAVGDRGHLHHLLLSSGHSHRRAVGVLYLWSGVVAFASTGPTFLQRDQFLIALGAAIAVAATATIVGRRRRPLSVRPSDEAQDLED
ncbi:MAG: MraY family glycosyltransferase [Nitriliruptoraceae bacterium]